MLEEELRQTKVPEASSGAVETDADVEEPSDPSEKIVEDLLAFQDELAQEAFAFADQHFQSFEVLESGEHQLENKQLHNQFNEIFELRLDEYLAAKGIAPQTFYEVLEERTAADSESTAGGGTIPKLGSRSLTASARCGRFSQMFKC